MSEEAKAVGEVAKAAGKAIDAGREVGGFLARFLKGSMEQGLGIFEDKLKYMRWERQVRLMGRANEFLKSRGLVDPTRPVPMKILVPLMQGGSLEEDDALQDLWARLLANAADANSGVEVRRAFLTILKDLTSYDALILQKLYAVTPGEDEASKGIRTGGLPGQIGLGFPAAQDAPPNEKVELALSNLVRLGLLDASGVWGGWRTLSCVFQTILGREFVKACAHG